MIECFDISQFLGGKSSEFLKEQDDLLQTQDTPKKPLLTPFQIGLIEGTLFMLCFLPLSERT